MATQTVPQFEINEIFVGTPSATTEQLRALIIGPDYAVRKYADNKAAVSIGVYADVDLAVAWPGRLAGEVVDQSYTSVKIDSAACRYYTDSSGTCQSVSGKPNRIKNAALNWATNGSNVRTGGIPCDVAVGDYVRVTNGGNRAVSTVTALIAEVVASSVGTATAAGSNVATNAGSSSATLGGSNVGTAAASVSGLTNPALYHGEAVGAHGQMSETYTITVTAVGAQGTGNAGNWTTVLLTITSASGTDADQVGVTPVPATPFAVGSRGARVTLSHGGSGNDFAVGDVFTVAVVQTYTVPTKAAAGTYTGATDTTYVVTVTKGGKIDSGTASNLRAQVTVSTTTGIDQGGPYTVLSGTPTVIGANGVSINFTGANLVVGDTFTILATAASTGAIETLQLADSLPSNLQSVALTVELAIVKNLDVPANRVGHAPLVNWLQSATQITLKSGILTTDTRTAALDLEVLSGNAYASYRALRTAGANVVKDIVVEADIAAAGFSGKDDQDAGLSCGLERALATSAGTTIKAISIATDDLAGYNAALGKLTNREDFYRVVPLTSNEAIIDAVAAFVNTRSGASVGRWATEAMGLALVTTKSITSGLATISDDADTTGTQYTIVDDTSGTGLFITKGVRPGDVVRAGYTSDGFGGQAYSSYTVDAVISESRLRLVAGPALAVSVSSTFQVWRDLTVAEQATDLATRTSARANRRITSVFPTLPKRAGVAYPGYYLACTLAALRGAAAPQQGLTNAEVAGWDDMTQASETFADQLDTLANAGMYIVTQSPTGTIYIRKQLTTDVSDVLVAEDSATVNVDSCAYYLKNLLSAIVGRSNNVPSNLDNMRAEVMAGINFLKTSQFTSALGAQMTDGTLVFLRKHATKADAVVARIDGDFPIPINNGQLDLVVSAG